MKHTLFKIVFFVLSILSLHAGVNGTYVVKGGETEGGVRTAFTGTIRMTDYRYGSAKLDLQDDGPPVSFKFTLKENLIESGESQTISASSSTMSCKLTFWEVDGRRLMKFTYKVKGEDITGSGSGSSEVNGLYRIVGSESEEGTTTPFNGKLLITNYKTAMVSIQLLDGGPPFSLKFDFTKSLKETTGSQTVSASNSDGSCKVTLKEVAGERRLTFTYRSSDGIEGSGKGVRTAR